MLWVPPPCAHPVRGSNGSNSGNFFSVDERRERIQIPFFSVGLHRPASETPFKWRYVLSLAGLIMATGIVSFHHSYMLSCSPVFGDNPQALASELSYIQVDKHRIAILYHIHQCRPCT